MSDKKTKYDTTDLEEAIAQVHAKLKDVSPTSEEYTKMVEQLDKLYKLKQSEKPERISRNAVLAIVGNLAGIGLILQHERIGVIGSKALGFVSKIRI